MVFSSKAVVAMSSPLNPSFVQHAQQGVRQARLSRKAGKLCKPSNQLFATSKQTKNTVIPYIKLGSLRQVRLICASARILDPTTQSWAGVAALQELHIGGSRHLRSAQASQIHIIPPQLQFRHTICEQTSSVPCHAQIGALRPYSSCHVSPDSPYVEDHRYERRTQRDCRSASADINRAPKRWVCPFNAMMLNPPAFTKHVHE